MYQQIPIMSKITSPTQLKLESTKTPDTNKEKLIKTKLN